MLDSITYDVSTRSRHSWFSLSGELDSISVFTEDVKDNLRESLIENLRVSIGQKKYKDAGVTFVYHYCSETTEKEFFSIEVSKEDY